MRAIRDAIAKIEAECEKTTDGMAKMLGRQIIDNITTDAVASKILQDQKTLDGCKKALDDFASKHKTGNMSCVGPDDALSVIYKYFEVGESAAAVAGVPARPRENKVIDVLDLI